MAEARCRDNWSHTSALLALLANIHRDTKRRQQAYTPDDFDPYRQRERKPTRGELAPVTILKDILIKGQ